MFRTILSIAAAGCLSLITLQAAERGDNDASAKHLSSSHRASAGDRVSKASSNKNSRLSRVRSHTSRRDSNATRRKRDRSRAANNRAATRRISDSVQPSDMNVQVELPSRENENANDIDMENEDQSVILLGTAADNEEEGGNTANPPNH